MPSTPPQSQTEPQPRTESRPAAGSSRRLAVFAVAVCVLAVAAAVVSFARGSFLGVVWVLMAGLSSNMAWYYVRKARAGVSR